MSELKIHGSASPDDQVASEKCKKERKAKLEFGLEEFQVQMIEQIMKSPGNEILFLPTGMGQNRIVDVVIQRMLDQYPGKHVVVCVLRPGQALSQAERLRCSLREDVCIGAYCGGDFLYDFPQEFQTNRVLVFTAGLLMRLTKLGVYSLDQSSLLVLHDAFHAVRNHPMNTLVREYYWKNDAKPKLLGTMLPQTQSLKRPFDKLRQVVRRLSHSAQAGICLPTGHALNKLASRIHHSHLAFHAYQPQREESLCIELIQKHLLHVWDVLHAHNQNHFGRLIHFPTVHGDSPGHRDSKTESTDSEELFVDPFHHDWPQILLMVRHSIAFTSNLPDMGQGHCRSATAIKIMEHVENCIHSLINCMSFGAKEGISVFVSGLKEFYVTLGNDVDLSIEVESRLTVDAKAAIFTSPLLQYFNLEVEELLEDSSCIITKFGDSADHSSRMEICKTVLLELGYSGEGLGNIVFVVVQNLSSGEMLKEYLRNDIPVEFMHVWNKGEHLSDITANIVFVTEDVFSQESRLAIIKSTIADIIWFNPANVMHAAGFDYDSAALTILRQLSGVGSKDSDAGNYVDGPHCHILATKEQCLAWIEISKADQVLLAAAEFVHCGDASLEESLSQLALNGKSMLSDMNGDLPLSLAIPPPSTILHTLCLGLCGEPPIFNLYPATTDGLWQATAVLPDNLVKDMAVQTRGCLRGSSRAPFIGQLASSSSEARDAAAEASLAYLIVSGTLSAYWQTKILVDLVVKPTDEGIPKLVEPRTNSPRVAQASKNNIPTSPFVGQTANPGNADNERLICSICGIVTTSEAHLKEHQKGRRHLKNLERLRQQQKATTVHKVELEEDPEGYQKEYNMPSEESQNHRLQNLSITNTIEQLPSTLSDAIIRRNSSQINRQNSNVYEGFPCVRVGDFALPSSMDLRAFLEEMAVDDSKSDPSPRLRDSQSSKVTPRQNNSNSRQSTPRNGGSRQSTPRNHSNRRKSLDGRQDQMKQPSFQSGHAFSPGYSRYPTVHPMDPHVYNNGMMFSYAPVQYVPLIQQSPMVAPSMVHPMHLPGTNGHIVPHFHIPGLSSPHEGSSPYRNNPSERQQSHGALWNSNEPPQDTSGE